MAETIRFTYQRLSDHLRAQVILDRNPSDVQLARTIRGISKMPRHWAMRGVISALVLLVPETRSKELATLLRFGKNFTGESWAQRDSGNWLRGVVQEAFFETLIWRSPGSFTKSTHDWLHKYLGTGQIDPYQWLGIVSGLACIPDHPLNAEWLHEVLWEKSLPVRDDIWSRKLLWVYYDDVNPVSRTVDWAWANPDAGEDVVRLVSLYLTWLFTSPNRRLRDTATKALVSVTTHHPEILSDLVRRFAEVNDPYVIDRLISACYGHILRRRHHFRTPDELVPLSALAQAVNDAVFGSGEPVAHLMLRHRAQMCVEIVEGLQHLGGSDRKLGFQEAQHRTTWPLLARPPEELALGFGLPFDGYFATELDWEFAQDLDRYVLAGVELPNQEEARVAAMRELSSQLEVALDRLIEETAASRKSTVLRRTRSLLAKRTRASGVDDAWSAFAVTLPARLQGHVNGLRRLNNQMAHLESDVLRPDKDLCLRWVAGRILELGWTKERFGESDGQLKNSRNTSTTERIAKKYERIAFQELCGHLADHCLIGRGWRKESGPYLGPWQISQTIDIDPSLLVRGDEPQGDGSVASRLRSLRMRAENQPAWWRTGVDHRLNPKTTNDEWLSDTSDILHPTALLAATDPEGREWLAIERHQEWRIKDSADFGVSYQSDKRQFWIRTQANIIRVEDNRHPSWAANTNWMGLRDVSTPPTMSVGGFGEYPDIGAWPSELDLSEQERRPYEPAEDPGLDELPLGWELKRINESGVPYALATVGCHQETHGDASSIETPGVLMPSRVLLQVLRAHWSGGLDDDGGLGLGPIEREFSWLSDGRVVAFCAAERSFGGTRALWVRAEPLRSALASSGLALWSWFLGEKIYWSGANPSSDRAECFAAVRLAPGPITTWGFTIEREHGGKRGDRGTRSRLFTERAPGLPDSTTARGRAKD